MCGAQIAPERAINGYHYGTCTRCALLQLLDQSADADVLGIYCDAYFHAGANGGYTDYLSEGSLLRAQGRRYGKLLERFIAPGEVLDIGSAAGFMVAGLQDAGWNARGLECNAGMSDWGRSNLQVHIDTESLEHFQSDAQFDALTMVQVVAHFYDLNSAFANASKLTKSGGVWLVETWNARSVTARVLADQWHELNPPSVRRIFTPQTLALTASRFGMRQIAFGRPKKRILAAHAKSLAAEKARSGVIAGALNRVVSLLPDNLVLPYPAEDLFWSIFRKTG